MSARILAVLGIIVATILYVTLGGRHCTPQKLRWERCEGWVLDWSTTKGRHTHGRVYDEKGPDTGEAQFRCRANSEGEVEWTLERGRCTRENGGQ